MLRCRYGGRFGVSRVKRPSAAQTSLVVFGLLVVMYIGSATFTTTMTKMAAKTSSIKTKTTFRNRDDFSSLPFTNAFQFDVIRRSQKSLSRQNSRNHHFALSNSQNQQQPQQQQGKKSPPLRPLPFQPLTKSLSLNRRIMVLSSCNVILLMKLFAPPTVANAAAMLGEEGSVRESVRRSASRLPGLGPPDIYYPTMFQGSWKVTRTIQIPAPLTLEYKMRFVPSTVITESSNTKDGIDNTNKKIDNHDIPLIVADRGFNQAALETALKQLRSPSSSVVVQSYEWDKTNPNDLRIIFVDGSRKEIKVTKRAILPPEITKQIDNSEMSEEKHGDVQTDGRRTTDVLIGVQSSEYQRITLEGIKKDGEDDNNNNNQRMTNIMVPTISARRTLNKWQPINNDTVEGLELVYDMGSNLDPMQGGGIRGASETPKLLTKSTLILERIKN